MPGRLTQWKGQEVFIEALNLVNKQLGYQSFYAVILGSDQGRDIYTKKIKRLAEQYRLTNQLKFIEHCKNMPLAYKISDLVVSASVEPEAFGRVAVEAQSMEKPIIASDIGGSNETIVDKQTGFLFKSGDPESLCKKIVEVLQLDESRLKSIGIEGRKNIIKKFNVEKMCFSTYSEYKKLLN
jgi:glycosyltransferase involved in cell wall biosynthesis